MTSTKINIRPNHGLLLLRVTEWTHLQDKGDVRAGQRGRLVFDGSTCHVLTAQI